MVLTKHQRCLGIDYGRKRIGLAVSDPTWLIATPLMIIENRGFKKTTNQLLAIMRQQEIGQIVIGLPLHANGDESVMSQEVRAFGAYLATFGYPITYVDERYTSLTAEEIIGKQAHREKLIDKVAASIILQVYLDERSKDESGNN